jgi:chromosome segregation ATPase
MSTEEIAALEKDIEVELASLQTALQTENRLDLDEDEIATLEKDIAALAAELATVRAEKRRAQHEPPPLTIEEQLAALQAENSRLKEVRQLETEIAALQKEIKRLKGKRAVLIVRKRELEKKPSNTRANDASRKDLPVEKVQEFEAVSLEALVNRDLIEDPRAGFSVADALASDWRDAAVGILKTLSPKEEKVVRMRFGIGCEREHTLEEIGQWFGVTRERIRQIETKALRQLRAPERARRLRALMAAR